MIVGATILNNDGTVRGTGMAGNAAGVVSFAADLDGDGVQEVVVGNALYRPDGSSIWANGLTDGFPAVADFELDGVPEIVVAASGVVRLQSSVDGAQIWNVPLPGGGVGGPPTITDYDGDGKPEIGVAGGSFYTVFDADGTVLWSQPTQDQSSSQTGSSVFAFEGDGIADVVYNDELRLWVYSGVEGSVKLNQAGHGSGTLWEYPVVVDVDADGQAEIVVINNNYAYGPKAGVTVIGDKAKSWVPGRRIWNQHSHHITNINDDGTVPAKAAQSWKNANNFRSGDVLPPDGTSAPDLVIQLTDMLRIEGTTAEQECDPGNNNVMKMFPFCGPAPG